MLVRYPCCGRLNCFATLAWRCAEGAAWWEWAQVAETRLEIPIPVRFALSSGAKIVVIFQVSEVHVMAKKNRSFLLMSLISASLFVSLFAVVKAQNPGAPAGRATKWSDAATWPNRKVPVAGDKVTIDAGKEVVLDVNTPPLNGLTINGKLSFANNKDVELTTEG